MTTTDRYSAQRRPLWKVDANIFYPTVVLACPGLHQLLHRSPSVPESHLRILRISDRDENDANISILDYMWEVLIGLTTTWQRAAPTMVLDSQRFCDRYDPQRPQGMGRLADGVMFLDAAGVGDSTVSMLRSQPVMNKYPPGAGRSYCKSTGSGARQKQRKTS